MKGFTIRYFTYDGTVETKHIRAYDEQTAVWKLKNCREVEEITPIG